MTSPDRGMISMKLLNGNQTELVRTMRRTLSLGASGRRE
jgi:hypothetical protein